MLNCFLDLPQGPTGPTDCIAKFLQIVQIDFPICTEKYPKVPLGAVSSSGSAGSRIAFPIGNIALNRDRIWGCGGIGSAK